MKTKPKGFLNTRKTKYAGQHILLEFWGAQGIDSVPIIGKALRQAVKAAGATLLKIDLHKFSPHDYAAIDIFTCGQKVNSKKAIIALKKFLKPKKVEVREVKRGKIGK
jgi:S-adenosylmethionine/arginine decarboxylase-like enzyme